jgi:hypothetical protein
MGSANPKDGVLDLVVLTENCNLTFYYAPAPDFLSEYSMLPIGQCNISKSLKSFVPQFLHTYHENIKEES